MAQMIENSDRGITLNKGLAWTIASALVIGGLWVGTTVTSLQSATASLNATLIDMKSDFAVADQKDTAIENRIRSLETGATRIDVQFGNLARSLEDVKGELRETNELLRQLSQGQKP